MLSLPSGFLPEHHLSRLLAHAGVHVSCRMSSDKAALGTLGLHGHVFPGSVVVQEESVGQWLMAGGSYISILPATQVER